eukprot:1160068-Pelagomonas_calceolata.AAC.4
MQTSGYEYSQILDSERLALHEKTLSRIYPDPEICKLAQKTFSASLTGEPCKKFFIHTDGGGGMSGNNDKTLMSDLHHVSLGDYACKPRREMFHKQTDSNANSATLSYNILLGKRVAVTEELESSCKLDGGLIKHLTNGAQAELKVRKIYPKFYMAHIKSKSHVGPNHCKFPRCDILTDTALTDRFVTIPYKSQFISGAREDPLKHVYRRDKDLGVKECKLEHMHWLLDGYKLHKPEGLGEDALTKYVVRFKNEVLFKQSPAYEILSDLLVLVPLRRAERPASRAWN